MTAASTAPSSPAGRSPRPRTGPGSRGWCGRWWAGGSAPGWSVRASLDPPPRAAVVEVPLLFEAGLQEGYDATIAVLADESLRRSRAAARGQVLLAERDARQLSQQEKAARATFVVLNDGTEQDLSRQLSEVLDKLDRP